MSKIDCRNRLKNGCCILTGGECTHETCTIKEPELQYGNNSKYEEALERARKGMPIDEVFPELRESEDERIRKALIRFFKNTHDWVNLKYDGNEIVAYLEKQKEQKPVHTAKEMWKEMRLEAYAQASGNRHEPNYSDDSTKMFSLCDIDEIFEKIGNSTVGSQPAEWSEEDENMLKTIFDSLETYAKNTHPCLKSVVEDEIAWLKSLRSQRHWKPSEEQMEALMWQIKNTSEGSWQRMASEDLYNELKSLP